MNKIKFRHSSKNHRDAEGAWYYIEYTKDKWKTFDGFGPIPKEVAEAIVNNSERLNELQKSVEKILEK